MIKIGITGGIGSGKSVVASLLMLSDVPVYIADKESKWLTNHSPVIREKLIAMFGNNIYIGKEINKPMLASHIFNNPEQLKQVNQIIHPEVNKHFREWVDRQTTPLCAIESAILFESGFHHIVDLRLMVYAPKQLRLKRALSRDATTKEAIERRMDNQMSDEEKRDKSDYIIYNDDKHALIPQVNKFIQYLLG